MRGRPRRSTARLSATGRIEALLEAPSPMGHGTCRPWLPALTTVGGDRWRDDGGHFAAPAATVVCGHRIGLRCCSERLELVHEPGLPRASEGPPVRIQPQ